jgi:hypothetical protein
VLPGNGVVIYTELAGRFSISSRENSSNNPRLIVTYWTARISHHAHTMPRSDA